MGEGVSTTRQPPGRRVVDGLRAWVRDLGSAGGTAPTVPFHEAVALRAGRWPFPAFDVARAMGIVVRLAPSDDEGLCGPGAYGRLTPGSREGDEWGEPPTMVIDAGRTETRQRHTAAVLIAHHVYHRDLLGLGVSVGPDPDALLANRLNDVGPRHRTQANVVAANLLMPWSAVVGTAEADVERRAALLGVTTRALRIRLGLDRPAGGGQAPRRRDEG